MANKKIFTDESLKALVDETKSYVNSAVSTKANTNHNHDDDYDTKGSASVVKDLLDTHTSNSSIHFTTTERTKLSGIEEGAQKNAVTGIKGSSESSYRTGNVNITKANIGLSNVNNTSDANKPVSTAQQTAIDSSLNSAKSYTDTKIANLINGAPTTLDTLGEIATAMAENDSVVEALESAVGTKANASDLTSHTSNKSNPHGVTKSQVGLGNVENKSSATIRSEITKSNVTTALGYTPYTQTEVDSLLDVKVDKVSGKGLSTNDYTTTEKDKLASIAEGAEVNQNAFGKVTVGSTTISADTATDTLTLAAGSNVTITPDATNDKITISATDTVYTHPSSHPASMITGLATVATSGSYNDLSNKPSIPAAYTLPTASSTLGGVKTTSTVTSTSGLTACPIISGVPYYKNTTYSAATTSAAGIVQLNDSTSSTSTTTAATANAVRAAYTLAGTANNAASSAKTTAESKSTVAASTTNGKIKINGTDTTVYEHPTTAGNKHIPSGGSNGQVLKWAASGTATWGTDKDTTYSLSSGDNNGTIKVTPSSGSAYNVAVKGLGSVAYQSKVPVANGGTGATTAAGAITNLGAMDLSSAQTVSGVKTFSNGIKLGKATMKYDSSAGAIVFTFE